ncbi:MAG: hypothetical protein KDK59_10460, partial [Simkania sp.]|nr:hypothetical protein [Simkania sp.]
FIFLIRNFFLCLIALQPIGLKERLGLCYGLIENENAGYITLKELVKLTQVFLYLYKYRKKNYLAFPNKF